MGLSAPFLHRDRRGQPAGGGGVQVFKTIYAHQQQQHLNTFLTLHARIAKGAASALRMYMLIFYAGIL